MRNLLELVKPDGCSPGEPRDLQIAEILAGDRAIEELPALLARLAQSGRWAPGPIAVVCDRNTRSAAGDLLNASLEASGQKFTFCELKSADGEDIVPDERTIGTALLAVPAETALMISLGSGTVTDITRYVAARIRLPFVAVATAPSVDGFTSSVAPLIVGGLKTTIDAAPPAAVLADTRILAAAPKRLLAAGVGDLAGKLTARLDWYLAHAINSEPRCDYIIELVADYVRRAISMDGKRAATAEGAADLFEGLVVSGLGITLVGSSRPASGAEHHISHFLEMQHERGNGPHFYHGESVAVGTYLVTALYHRLVGRTLDEIEVSVDSVLSVEGRRRMKRVEEARVALLRKLFGASAESLVSRYYASRPTPERRREVLSRLKSHWTEICDAVQEYLPPPEELSASFRRIPVPHRPQKVGLSPDMRHSALLCAKEVRTRYSLLTLLDELGMLESEAESLAV